MTAPRWLRRYPVIIVAAVAVVGLAGCTSNASTARGASTPKTAATLFVGAINAGSGAGAAAISCPSFASDARSEARSGADPGISFTLGTVTQSGDTAAAILNQQTNVGGSNQDTAFTLTLRRSSGLWLVCGQH